jgi:hypothetical protein
MGDVAGLPLRSDAVVYSSQEECSRMVLTGVEESSPADRYPLLSAFFPGTLPFLWPMDHC